MPKVSVVIPTYNRADLVMDCLDSLAWQTEQDLEIIVVDDASTDGTAKTIANRFPEVRVLRMPRNSGYASATNAGIRAATGDWILLLNNDVTMDACCIENLLSFAEVRNAYMAAPLLLWRDDSGTIYSAGDRLATGYRPEAIGFRQPREGFDFSEEPIGVSGACGLFSRIVFDEVGLLEESFVAYFEDADLCLRAYNAGLEGGVVPEAVAYHIGSASIAGNTWWRSAQCYRNHALLVLRNVSWRDMRRHAGEILRERRHQRRMMFSAARAHFGALRAAGISLYYMAWLAISVPRALWQRRRIVIPA